MQPFFEWATTFVGVSVNLWFYITWLLSSVLFKRVIFPLKLCFLIALKFSQKECFVALKYWKLLILLNACNVTPLLSNHEVTIWHKLCIIYKKKNNFFVTLPLNIEFRDLLMKRVQKINPICQLAYSEKIFFLNKSNDGRSNSLT